MGDYYKECNPDAGTSPKEYHLHVLFKLIRCKTVKTTGILQTLIVEKAKTVGENRERVWEWEPERQRETEIELQTANQNQPETGNLRFGMNTEVVSAVEERKEHEEPQRTQSRNSKVKI